jgi:hypothetical protein
MPLTAVLGQEGDEFAGSFKVDGVEDAPIHPPRAEQSSALEMRQVMRQRRRGDREAQRNFPGR